MGKSLREGKSVRTAQWAKSRTRSPLVLVLRLAQRVLMAFTDTTMRRVMRSKCSPVQSVHQDSNLMTTKTVARRALTLGVCLHTATTIILVASCAMPDKWQTKHRLAVKYALWERPVQTETALSAMLEHPRAQTELPACRAPVAPLGWVDSASHVLLAQNQTHPCRRVSSVLMALWGRKAPAILNVSLGLHQTVIERRVCHAQLSLARTVNMATPVSVVLQQASTPRTRSHAQHVQTATVQCCHGRRVSYVAITKLEPLERAIHVGREPHRHKTGVIASNAMQMQRAAMERVQPALLA